MTIINIVGFYIRCHNQERLFGKQSRTQFCPKNIQDVFSMKKIGSRSKETIHGRKHLPILSNYGSVPKCKKGHTLKPGHDITRGLSFLAKRAEATIHYSDIQIRNILKRNKKKKGI